MRACTLWWLCVATLATCARGAAWWESTVVYQIYPRSFKDSDGDGVGDLNGITAKLDYLKELGVDAIWLSPIYKSPMFDFGYDIEDYKAIDPIFGTMANFENLLAEAKSRGIRVVLDFVPNHTSHLSSWFNSSVAKEETYKDYYIWADGKTLEDGTKAPPSNWISVFGKSAWEYHPIREQYYLHQFAIQQPDINYRSEALQNEMKAVLRFWLDKGVSGFRVDAINYLYEIEADANGQYKDEPFIENSGVGSDDYAYLDHIYTRDRDETYNVVYDWRKVLNEYTTSDESKIMLTEGYTDIDHMMKYYGTDTVEGSIPFNFVYLGQITKTSDATQIKTVIDTWMNKMPAGRVANWVNGNHDNSRLATRYGVNRVDTMNLLALLLPGVSITYQGEELGMTDGEVTLEQTVDPQACNDPDHYLTKSRDPARTPFHWDSTAFAGFTTGSSTWLPVASNYAKVNVAVERANARSHLNFYKDVVALKHTSPVMTGDLTTDAPSDTVMVITRTLSTNAVVGVINLAETTQNVDLSSLSKVPQNLKVAATGVACSLEKGVQIQKNKIVMPPYCVLALQTAETTTTSTSTTTRTTTTSTPTTTRTTTTTTPTTTRTTTTATQTTTESGNNAGSKINTTSFLVYSILYLLYKTM